ncbi:MAG: 3-phosphoshikimate 1-carboxyvinyltransferase, partial [Flavobacteriales bacterium]
DPPPFDPQGDHRMAMSLAPLALVCNAITILHPEVVAKSYPGFWEDLRSLGFSVECSEVV